MNTFIKYILVLLVITGAVFAITRSNFSFMPEQEQDKDTTNLPSEESEEITADMQSAARADIITNFGAITVALYPQEAPVTVDNFIKLARADFYNGTKFHRVIKDFMIQGGDPNSRDDDWSDDGRGGPGYSFKDEFNEHKMVRGALAMANSGPHTNGSQFFIVTAKEAAWLDGKHAVFGSVVEGMEVVDAIEAVRTNENDHPLDNVAIERIVISK